MSSDPTRPDPAAHARDRAVPHRWGWMLPGGGRAGTVQSATAYQGTSNQLCGLFPFAVGSGSAPRGVPIGRHMLTAEPIGLDPAQWLRDGLVTSTGLWLQGQPGTGKSTLIKRLLVGLVDAGFLAVVPGDVKGEYSPLVEALGGSVWRVARGSATRVNPLDVGPLRAAAAASSGPERTRLIETVRARQLSLLEALIRIVRRDNGDGVSTTEQLLLGRALDLAVAADPDGEPIIPDLLAVLAQAPRELQQVTASPDAAAFSRDARELVNSLGVLVEGAIRGLFDARSTVRPALDTPAMSLDISALASDDDEVVAAAMLSAWAWSAAQIDAAQALGHRLHVYRVMDELWRALRAAPGLVELADRLTRLNRHSGEVTVQSTHNFADLEALPRPEDVAKARGLAGRNAIMVLLGIDASEIEALGRITRITSGEAGMLTSWASPPTWIPGQMHPGRGKLLLKSGSRLGIPVELTLTATERRLYDTDQAWRDPVRAGWSGALPAVGGAP